MFTKTNCGDVYMTFGFISLTLMFIFTRLDRLAIYVGIFTLIQIFNTTSVYLKRRVINIILSFLLDFCFFTLLIIVPNPFYIFSLFIGLFIGSAFMALCYKYPAFNNYIMFMEVFKGLATITTTAIVFIAYYDELFWFEELIIPPCCIVFLLMYICYTGKKKESIRNELVKLREELQKNRVSKYK